MRNTVHTFPAILLILTLCFAPRIQAQDELFSQKVTVKPNIGFEMFQRNIDVFSRDSDNEEWEKDESGSKIKTYFFTLGAELELRRGFSVGAFVGFAVSDYDPVFFRRLPLSLEVEAKKTRGFIAGVDIYKSVFAVKDIEVGGFGQLLYHKGSEKNWDIPGLNVEGSVSLKPWWMCASIGPIFTYKGSDSFFPYASLRYNRLWGKLRIDEEVQDLKGTEEKKFSGKSHFSISAGAQYMITESFGIAVRTDFLPYSGGVDLGLSIKLMYSL